MEIKKETVINASAARVYKAITDSKQLTKWFPDVESIEPRIEGKISFKFLEDGTNIRNDKRQTLEGKIVELEENKKLSYTWENSAAPEFPLTRVTWVLEEIDVKKQES